MARTRPATATELEGPPIPYEIIDQLLDKATPLVVRQLAKKYRKTAGKAEGEKNGRRKNTKKAEGKKAGAARKEAGTAS